MRELVFLFFFFFLVIHIFRKKGLFPTHLSIHKENFMINITEEFCNGGIDEYPVIIYYPVTSCVLFIFKRLRYVIIVFIIFLVKYSPSLINSQQEIDFTDTLFLVA